MKILGFSFWEKKPPGIKTKYRIFDSLDIYHDWDIQFQHADGTWRYIHNKHMDAVETSVTQDNCPLRRNGFSFTLKGSHDKMVEFATDYPDIEIYLEQLRKKQRAHQEKTAVRVRENKMEYL